MKVQKKASIVSHVNFSSVEVKTKDTVLEAVESAMLLAEYKKYVRGRHIFIKPNLLTFTLVPGQCTSPWVLEGVIRVLLRDGFDVVVGDADVATRKQVEKAALVWGTKALCEKYEIPFINLSRSKTKEVKVEGEIFKRIEIPTVLLDADTIVTVPVLKTHNITGMTFSLKNQWGCLTSVRQKYHLVVDKCIAEINKFLNVSFAVGDGTVCLEGDGPVTGRPRVVNSILASSDLVALDCAGCSIMGINPTKVGHIMKACEMNIGSIEFEIRGDPLPNYEFLQPILTNHPIVSLEMKLRKIPLLNWLLFETPIFEIPAFIASRYNTIYWYNRYGKKYALDVFNNWSVYLSEFFGEEDRNVD